MPSSRTSAKAARSAGKAVNCAGMVRTILRGSNSFDGPCRRCVCRCRADARADVAFGTPDIGQVDTGMRVNLVDQLVDVQKCGCVIQYQKRGLHIAEQTEQ